MTGSIVLLNCNIVSGRNKCIKKYLKKIQTDLFSSVIYLLYTLLFCCPSWDPGHPLIIIRKVMDPQYISPLTGDIWGYISKYTGGKYQPVWHPYYHKKWPEKLRRYAPTKGNQEKTHRIIDIIDIIDIIHMLDIIES